MLKYNYIALMLLVIILIFTQVNELEAINHKSQLKNKVKQDVQIQQPIAANILQVNAYVVLGAGNPCQIISIENGEANEQGIYNLLIKGKDIFTEKIYLDIFKSDQTVYTPIVLKNDYKVISLDQNNYLVLMSATGEIKSDLTLPNTTENDIQVSQCIKDGLDQEKETVITVFSSMLTEKVMKCFYT